MLRVVSTSCAVREEQNSRQEPIHLSTLVRVHCEGVLGAGLEAVLVRVESEQPCHPGEHHWTEAPDEHPAVDALERVVRLEPGCLVARVSVRDALARVEGHAVALRLGDSFVLSEVDDLAASGLVDLPKRHHRRRPPRQRRDVVAGEDLRSLRWARGVARDIHHAAVRLRQSVVAGAAEIVLLAVLAVRRDAHDDEARVDRKREFIADAVALARTGSRRFHPHVRDLPQRHEELEPSCLLQVETHRELVLGDVGLVGAMRSWAACEKGRGRAERVAAGTLDVDDFRAELGQLGPDVGLGDQHTSADCTDPGERAECGHQGGRGRPLQRLDPVRDLASVLLDPVVADHQPFVMCHRRPPSIRFRRKCWHDAAAQCRNVRGHSPSGPVLVAPNRMTSRVVAGRFERRLTSSAAPVASVTTFGLVVDVPEE